MEAFREGWQRGFREWSGSGQGEEIKTMSKGDLGILSTMGKLGITGNQSKQQSTHSTQNTHNIQPNLKTKI